MFSMNHSNCAIIVCKESQRNHICRFNVFHIFCSIFFSDMHRSLEQFKKRFYAVPIVSFSYLSLLLLFHVILFVYLYEWGECILLWMFTVFNVQCGCWCSMFRGPLERSVNIASSSILKICSCISFAEHSWIHSLEIFTYKNRIIHNHRKNSDIPNWLWEYNTFSYINIM